jgi:hypothetical protein
VLRRAVRARAGAIVLGAAGPLAALALLRSLERADAPPGAFFLVPVAAIGCAAIVGWGLARWRGVRRALPRWARASA